MGLRPISDFETHPAGAVPPNCYMRLNPEASIREDRVPKESVLLPKEEAQKCMLQALHRGNCVNSKILPFKGNYTIFQTSPDMINPWSTKILEEIYQAIKENKQSMPAMRELDATSLLCPNDSPIWSDVCATFRPGKLSPDVASEQLKEDMPKLRDTLIDLEYRSRTRLADSILAMAYSELLISLHLELPELKPIVKPVGRILARDLWDFCSARRNCRKHVLFAAKVKHETNRLIDGPIWGEHLFSQELVDECLAAARTANQSLRTRWGFPFKRKWESGRGPFPKNKRFRGKSPARSTPPQITLPVAGPSSNQQYIVVPNPNFTQSPAQNLAYEASYSGYSNRSARGPRGPRGSRGGRGRGASEGQSSASSSRGQPFQRGPRGPRGGRGHRRDRT